MKILITNDDGIDAYGLALLEQLARTISDDITIVAPMDNRPGTVKCATCAMRKVQRAHRKMCAP